MTRSELIKRLMSKYSYMSTSDSELVVAAVFDAISDSIIKGGKVELRGFGVFGSKRRQARIAKNPKTGENIQIGERSAVFFKMGKKMQNYMNENVE